MKKPTSLILIVFGCLFGSGLAGTKEEVIRLQSDVLKLQKQVLQLQKSFDENNGTVQSLLEQLNDQVAYSNRVLEEMVTVMRDQKKDFIRAVSGLGEEIQQVGIKLDDTNNRVATLQKKIEEQQTQAVSRSIPSFSQPGGPKPDQIYSLAFNDYLAGNYEIAIAEFHEFLVKYPESEYADNAAYYLGISFQQTGRPEKAIHVFDEIINVYPKADMTPAAYYKKALVEQELQNNEDAIETFKKLVILFPETQEAIIATRELESLGVDVSELADSRRP